MALLVQNMERLDEQVKEEADGIYNTLGKKTTQTNTNTNPQSSARYGCVTSDSLGVRNRNAFF